MFSRIKTPFYIELYIFTMVYKEVQDVARLFKSGEPVSTEIELENDSIVLLFDNGHLDDVNSTYVITTLMVKKDEFEYNTNAGVTLEDIIPSLSDVAQEVIDSFETVGLETNTVFEYDKSNSSEKYLDFVLIIYP